MTSSVSGPATLTIDWCYLAKRSVCSGWDGSFGLTANDALRPEDH
jgi:hypothetical protein